MLSKVGQFVLITNIFPTSCCSAIIGTKNAYLFSLVLEKDADPDPDPDWERPRKLDPYPDPDQVIPDPQFTSNKQKNTYQAPFCTLC